MTLYVDFSYGGHCVSLGLGDWHLSGFSLDMRVSSITMPAGAYHVTLFDQPSWQGTPGYFDSSVPVLTGYWNDRARSVSIRRLVATPVPTQAKVSCDVSWFNDEVNTGWVTLYAEGDFTGKCVTLSPGHWGHLSQFGLARSVSSIENPGSAYRVTLFDEENIDAVPLSDKTIWRGNSSSYDASVSSLSSAWNDRALAVRIERRSTGVSTPGPPLAPLPTPAPSTAPPSAAPSVAPPPIINSLGCPNSVPVNTTFRCAASVVTTSSEVTYYWRESDNLGPMDRTGHRYGTWWSLGPTLSGVAPISAGNWSIELRVCYWSSAESCSTAQQQITVTPYQRP